MPVRLLNGAEVENLLSVEKCIDLMAEALLTLARGDANLPLRTVLRLPGKGALGLMPAELKEPAAIGLKAITVFPGNHGTAFDSHQGIVLLFEPTYGSLVGIVDASSVTAIRTAAVSGVATRLLALEDASDLAILGAGVQARTHLAAMRAVRPIERVRVWSRTPERREAFAAWAADQDGIEVTVANSAEEAADGAQIICTVTASTEPVLQADWVLPGTHVNAVGASLPEARELDSSLVARGRLFVDRRESATHEAGDYLIPLREGAITERHILGEIGELLLGAVPGRTTKTEVTIFESLGLAVQDVAAVAWLIDEAARKKVGTEVSLGGSRADSS